MTPSTQTNPAYTRPLEALRAALAGLDTPEARKALEAADALEDALVAHEPPVVRVDF
jgi:hypothetical protein